MHLVGGGGDGYCWTSTEWPLVSLSRHESWGILRNWAWQRLRATDRTIEIRIAIVIAELWSRDGLWRLNGVPERNRSAIGKSEICDRNRMLSDTKNSSCGILASNVSGIGCDCWSLAICDGDRWSSKGQKKGWCVIATRLRATCATVHWLRC